jgi:hypothetical protein
MGRSTGSGSLTETSADVKDRFMSRRTWLNTAPGGTESLEAS